MFSDGIQNKIYILRRRAWVQEVWVGIWWLIGYRKCDVKEEHFCFTWITTERVVMSFPERRNRGERTSLRGSREPSFEHSLRCQWLSGVTGQSSGERAWRTPELKNLPHEGGSGTRRTWEAGKSKESGQSPKREAQAECGGITTFQGWKGEPEKRKSGNGWSQKEKRKTSRGRPAWQQPKWSKI